MRSVTLLEVANTRWTNLVIKAWTWKTTILIFKILNFVSQFGTLCLENLPYIITTPWVWIVNTRQGETMFYCGLQQFSPYYLIVVALSIDLSVQSYIVQSVWIIATGCCCQLTGVSLVVCSFSTAVAHLLQVSTRWCFQRCSSADPSWNKWLFKLLLLFYQFKPV